MMSIRSALFGLALLAGAAGASAAVSADVYYVDYSTTTAPPSQWQSLNIGSLMSNVSATGILLSFGADSPTAANQTVLTLCDDIYHDIYVPVSYSGHELVYTAQPLAGSTYFVQGGTAVFTANQASLLGQLIGEAQAIWAGTAPSNLFGLGLSANDEIAAIQGAIWQIEYNQTVTSATGNAGINTAIGDFVSQYTPGSNTGVGLYSTNGTQNQVIGLGPSPAPEPSVWAMMVAGLIGLGAMFGLRRKSGISAQA